MLSHIIIRCACSLSSPAWDFLPANHVLPAGSVTSPNPSPASQQFWTPIYLKTPRSHTNLQFLLEFNKISWTNQVCWGSDYLLHAGLVLYLLGLWSCCSIVILEKKKKKQSCVVMKSYGGRTTNTEKETKLTLSHFSASSTFCHTHTSAHFQNDSPLEFMGGNSQTHTHKVYLPSVIF